MEAVQARREVHLGRRQADQELVELLARDSFAGPRYRRFEEELARYSISVLRSWMHTGYIFELTASRGFRVSATSREREELTRSADARDELANMTTALALPRFRDQALRRGGWRPDGGASLATYFMGYCLAVFPNEFRKRRLERQRYVRARDAVSLHLESVIDHNSDPASITLGVLSVRDAIAGLDSKSAGVVAATLAGYSHEEVSELFGLPSARAVEGILYRWRSKQKATRSEGGDQDGSE